MRWIEPANIRTGSRGNERRADARRLAIYSDEANVVRANGTG